MTAYDLAALGPDRAAVDRALAVIPLCAAASRRRAKEAQVVTARLRHESDVRALDHAEAWLRMWLDVLDAGDPGTAIDVIPRCSTHGIPMVFRPAGTPEQEWCGAWYDCPGPAGGPRCEASTLIPSVALRGQHARSSVVSVAEYAQRVDVVRLVGGAV